MCLGPCASCNAACFRRPRRSPERHSPGGPSAVHSGPRGGGGPAPAPSACPESPRHQEADLEEDGKGKTRQRPPLAPESLDENRVSVKSVSVHTPSPRRRWGGPSLRGTLGGSALLSTPATSWLQPSRKSRNLSRHFLCAVLVGSPRHAAVGGPRPGPPRIPVCVRSVSCARGARWPGPARRRRGHGCSRHFSCRLCFALALKRLSLACCCRDMSLSGRWQPKDWHR